MAGTTVQENLYHWSYLLTERVKEGGVISQAFAWTGWEEISKNSEYTEQLNVLEWCTCYYLS
jgi:hypothetical protein